MAEPGWYRQRGGVGYWDGQAWTAYHPNPDAVPTWAFITWTGLMVLMAVDAFATRWLFACSPDLCSSTQIAVLVGSFAIALLALAGLLAWGMIRPVSSIRVMAVLVMPIAVLGAVALPTLFSGV